MPWYRKFESNRVCRMAETGAGAPPSTQPPTPAATTNNTAAAAASQQAPNLLGDAAPDATNNTIPNLLGDAAPAIPPEDNVVPANGVYDFELGENVFVNRELLQKLSPKMKELGLTIYQAKQLSGELAQYSQGLVQAQEETYRKTIDQWVDAAKKDPYLAPNPKAFAESIDLVKDVLKKFDAKSSTQGTASDESVLTLLANTGLANHPAILSLLKRVGEATAQRPPVTNTPNVKANVTEKISLREFALRSGRVQS